jgi:uncharacterized membrane protein
MAALSVFQFGTENGAQQASDMIGKLQKQAVIQVQDAAIITWPIGSKKPKTKHLSHLGGVGALDGAFWGTLFGLIFFVPFFGMESGAATGAFAAKFKDYGITAYFINSIRRKVTEGTSAVFLLTSGGVLDKIVLAARSLPKSELITSNLSIEQEAALRAGFTDEEASVRV